MKTVSSQKQSYLERKKNCINDHIYYFLSKLANLTKLGFSISIRYAGQQY